MTWMQRINDLWAEFMVQIGSLFVPIAPALLLGYGVFITLPHEMGALRYAAAIAAPIGATAVEFTSGKMFVKAWGEGRSREMAVAAFVGLVSITVITAGVLTLEASGFQKVLNIGLYVVSLVTYLAQSLNQLSRKRESEENEKASSQIRIMELEVEKEKAVASAARANSRAVVASSTASTAVLPQSPVVDAVVYKYEPEVRQFHGTLNGTPFSRQSIEDALGVQRTKAGEMIKSGVALGLFAPTGKRNQYLAIHKDETDEQ